MLLNSDSLKVINMPNAKKKNSENRNKPCNNFLEMISNQPQKVKIMFFLLSHKYSCHSNI